MRRRSLIAALLVAGAVALGASWLGFSGRQGLTPLKPAAAGSEEIDDLYLFIAVFAIVILLSVMIPLALILGRYRERGLPRHVEGPQIRGNTRLELTWTAIPVLIVAVLVAFTLYKAGDIRNPARAASQPADVRIDVEGRQFYWRYVYANGAIAYDRLRIPVGEVTELTVTAPATDVIHSYWVPALGGKVDAIPGQTNHLKYRPSRTGVFAGKCAELCGLQHAAMLFQVEVLPRAEFRAWLARQAATQRAGTRRLGASAWRRVCSKCHFAAPEYAPNIADSPILANAQSIRQIVTHGQGLMPAVGRGWTETELDSLTKYLKSIAPKGATSGG